MNDRVAIPLSKIRKARPFPKGRAVDVAAREEIASLLGGAPLTLTVAAHPCSLPGSRDPFGRKSVVCTLIGLDLFLGGAYAP